MKKIIGFGIAVLSAIVVSAPQAQAQTSGTTTVSSLIPKSISLTVTSNVAANFTAAELQSDDNTSEALDAITGVVKSNCNTIVNVSGSAIGGLKSEDISLQITAPPADARIQGFNGFGGGYVPLSDSAQDLIGFNNTQMTQDTFKLNVKVSNAHTYTGSGTAYTNTLTFTAVAQ